MGRKHEIHDEICLVNNYIRELAYRLESVYLVDLDILSRNHFTRNGLHLNSTGKYKLAKLIYFKLKQIFGKNKSVTSFLKTTQEPTTNNNCISIIERHMSSVIEQHQEDNTVAFAHSISGDFDDERRMTAGVAVVFAKHFKKPTVSECITDHLALQGSQTGALVRTSRSEN